MTAAAGNHARDFTVLGIERCATVRVTSGTRNPSVSATERSRRFLRPASDDNSDSTDPGRGNPRPPVSPPSVARNHRTHRYQIRYHAIDFRIFYLFFFFIHKNIYIILYFITLLRSNSLWISFFFSPFFFVRLSPRYHP